METSTFDRLTRVAFGGSRRDFVRVALAAATTLACSRFGSHRLNRAEAWLSVGSVPPRQIVPNMRCRAKRSAPTTDSPLMAS